MVFWCECGREPHVLCAGRTAYAILVQSGTGGVKAKHASSLAP
jgi:hypothetical protein